MGQMTQKRQIAGWVLYDWANSAFSTIVITFVFATYFGRSVVGDETQGSAWWGYALAISGFLIGILSPITGAIADHYGSPKRFLVGFAGVSLIGIAGLWFATPAADSLLIMAVLAALVVANIGFELSFVFYNALLPGVASRVQLGKISNLGWASGYLGGLVALALVLFGLIGLGETKPLLDLPRDQAQHVRASIPLVVVWYTVFSLPLLLWVKGAGRTGLTLPESVGRGLGQLKQSLQATWLDKTWFRFLIGSALYRDGLSTLFAVGGLYAAGRYGMATADILVFGILMNVTAGLGCFAAMWLEDRMGSMRCIRAALIGLMITGFGVVLAPDKTWFFITALSLGLFVGPLQASSRSYVAKLASTHDIASRFGLYSLTGRAVSFLGPLAFAIVTDITDNQAYGLSTLLLFWGVGYAMVAKMKDPE